MNSNNNKTYSRRQPSSKQLLLLLGLSADTMMTASSAYQHQVMPNRVWGQTSSATTDPKKLAPIRKPTQSAPKYDLGLGKNLPVTALATVDSSSATHEHHHSTIQDAVEYLVEHDGAMNYPSPDMVRRHRERLAVAAKKPVPLPAAYSSQERVWIPQHERDGRYVVDRSSTSDLDMNTAWVQLLYLEQQKLAAATAASAN